MPKKKEPKVPVNVVVFPEPEEYTCCLCGKTVKGWGNNPSPLNNDPNARCCDECNYTKVIPARMEEIALNFGKEHNI